MKRIVVLLFFAIGAQISLNAQEFQWAKKFTGLCNIYSVQPDSKGNIYLMGENDGQLNYDGTRIWDSVGVGTFLVKLDSAGNLLWSKFIHQLGQLPSPCNPNFMQLVGDTAVLMMTGIFLADELHPLYYLDTVIPACGLWGMPSQYPFPNDTLRYHSGNALIKLNENGELLDHHFLHSVPLDSAGNRIALPKSDDLMYQQFCTMTHPVWVDNEGYVYMGNDYVNWYNEDKVGMLIDLRQRAVFDRPVFHGSPLLMKFAPSLDSIVWCKPIFRALDSGRLDPLTGIIHLMSMRGLVGDNQGNLFFSLSLPYDTGEPPFDFNAPLKDYSAFVPEGWKLDILLDDNDTSQRIRMKYGMDGTSAILSYDTDGNLRWCNQLKTTPTQPMPFIMSNRTYIQGLAYQSETSSITATVSFRDNSIVIGPSWALIVGGDTLRHLNSGQQGFIRYSPSDGHVLSYSFAQASEESYGGTEYPMLVAPVVANNQIFAQTRYRGDLPTFTNTLHGRTDHDDLGFIRWASDGHAISAIDFNTYGYTGPIAIDQQGSLYLTGTATTASATFGNIQLGAGVYIAKLSDPSFNTPYTPTPREQTIAWTEELTFPEGLAHRLNAVATSLLPVTYTVDDPTVARISHDTLFPLRLGTTTLRANQPGDAWWHPAPEVARQLTVSERFPQQILGPASIDVTLQYHDPIEQYPDGYFEIHTIPLEYSATSGLPLTYTIDDTTLCHFWETNPGQPNSNLYLVTDAPGRTTLRVNQPGNQEWAPAPELAVDLIFRDSRNPDDPDTTHTDPNAIAPVAPEQVLSVEYFDLLGRRLPASPARGLYLERTLTPTGVTTRKILKQ